MSFTSLSCGHSTLDSGLAIEKRSPGDRVIALAGNPNVGKSTVFNALTGMNQHTGNWSGKTVAHAQGYCTYKENSYVLVDIPGCYSLMAHSAEEEVARDFICFGEPDAVIVVCDATCLERNLNLALQTMEICKNVVLCVNLMDEAARKGVRLDLQKISAELGIPVVATAARGRQGLDEMMACVSALFSGNEELTKPLQVRYIQPIEQAIQLLEPAVQDFCAERMATRWLSLQLLEGDASLLRALEVYLHADILADAHISAKLQEAWLLLEEHGVSGEALQDKIASCLVLTAEGICCDTVLHEPTKRDLRDRKIDRILTSRWTGFPIMFLMLAVVFWLTITGSNYPSALLSQGLFWVQEQLSAFFVLLGTPAWVGGLLVDGVFRVLAWVVSVMLPPMAIFFPLFTLLEDFGYLPRVAFNLDKYFKKCCACGKQALTMCMGFGCNAVGIIGCRIIDSPRERLIAMITNNFVPCNGRFPPPFKGQQKSRHI